MPKTVPVEVRVADMPQMQQFIGSVAGLLKALAKCAGQLPEPVMEAAGQVRLAVAALGVRDVGPPPAASDEDLIRRAQAQEYPGRAGRGRDLGGRLGVSVDGERAARMAEEFRLPDGTWSCVMDGVPEPCGDCGGCRYIAAVNAANAAGPGA